jgi:flavin reductase (DIM6/NTAB) family NADH-FMN oxidoreductase RutF
MCMQSIQESDARAFRKTLGHFASGVTVITTVQEGRVHGMTATAFCAVSFEPPLVLVSVENRRHMHRLLRQSGCYGVSILSQDQEELSRHFAGRSQEGLQVPFVWHQGCPLIEGAIVHLICKVIDAHPAGDHTLYLGQVEHLSYSDEGAPLLFYSGKYHALRCSHFTSFTPVS